ncbi:hypothetical protein JHK85_010459 [Glycine max]|nr:hypothetical protein JHK85_010459 [Glycine max]
MLQNISQHLFPRPHSDTPSHANSPSSQAPDFPFSRDTYYLKTPKFDPCPPHAGWWSAFTFWAAHGGCGSAAPTRRNEEFGNIFILGRASATSSSQYQKPTSATSPDLNPNCIIKHVTYEDTLGHAPPRFTLPIFAIDDRSEAHGTLASVTFLLLGETLTKFPGNPLLEASKIANNALH